MSLVRKVYVESGDFEVPYGVSQVMVLAVGGGAGGGTGGQGGGGSGYVKCELLNVREKDVIPIIVGKGGAPGHNGGQTSFGTLLHAEGGYTANGTNGGDGGSGGGAGSPLGYTECAGNGGWKGEDGLDVEPSKGGIGQKDWYIQTQNFTLNRITSGVWGSGGFVETECAAHGGGGAGGVNIDDQALLVAGNGKSSHYCEGEGGTGFGAGGGGGGTLVNMTNAEGGHGADGVVYIEFEK